MDIELQEAIERAKKAGIVGIDFGNPSDILAQEIDDTIELVKKHKEAIISSTKEALLKHKK